MKLVVQFFFCVALTLIPMGIFDSITNSITQEVTNIYDDTMALAEETGTTQEELEAYTIPVNSENTYNPPTTYNDLANPVEMEDDSFFGSLVHAVEHPVDTMEDIGNTVLDAVEHPIDTVESLGSDVVDMVTDIGNDVVDGAQSIVDGVEDLGNNIIDGVKDVGGDVVDGVEDIGNKIKDGVETLAGGAVDFTEDAWDAVKDAADFMNPFSWDIWGEIKGALIYIVIGGGILTLVFWPQIKEGGKKVYDGAKQVVQDSETLAPLLLI